MLLIDTLKHILLDDMALVVQWDHERKNVAVFKDLRQPWTNLRRAENFYTI